MVASFDVYSEALGRPHSADGIMPDPSAETCVTVGDYIAGVITKELWAVQLLRQPASENFDPKLIKALLADLAPSLPDDVIDAVRGWIPVVEEVSPSSLLPDLEDFPMAAEEEEALDPKQRKLLMEALAIVLDVFNETDLEGDAANLTLPLLPRSSIASVSVQIAAMLEHLAMMRPRAEQQLQSAEIDLASWQRVCASGNERPAPGSKRELVQELQQCRAQIFDLEKDRLTQAKVAEASAHREKREAEKTLQHLFTVNQALEEKLRDRTIEFNNSSQRICDLERRINHEQSLVQEKGKRIKVLENELARCARMQDDLLSREREYGKRILQLKVEEFMGLCRDHQRKKRLESAINGKSLVGVEDEEPTEQDLHTLANDTLHWLEHQFDAFFEERQQSIQEVSRQAEESVERERKGIEQTHQEVLEAHRAWSRQGTGMLSPLHRSVGVQAEPGSPLGARKTAMQAEIGSHLSWASNTPSEARSGMNGEARHRAKSVHEVARRQTMRHSSLILEQAQLDFTRADRHNSLILAQPIHRKTMGADAPPMESVMEFLESHRASLQGRGSASGVPGVDGAEEKEGESEKEAETKQVQVSDKEEHVDEAKEDTLSEKSEEYQDGDQSSSSKAPEPQGQPQAQAWPRLQRNTPETTREVAKLRRGHTTAYSGDKGRSMTPSTRESSRPESRSSSFIPSRSGTPWQDSGMPQLKKAGTQWTPRDGRSNRTYPQRATQRRTVLESIR